MSFRTAFFLFMTLTACTALSPGEPQEKVEVLQMTKTQLFATIKKAYELGYKDGAEDACKTQKKSI